MLFGHFSLGPLRSGEFSQITDQIPCNRYPLNPLKEPCLLVLSFHLSIYLPISIYLSIYIYIYMYMLPGPYLNPIFPWNLTKPAKT